MRKVLLALGTGLLVATLGVGEAEAKRLGGGANRGIQREIQPQQPARAAPAATSATSPAGSAPVGSTSAPVTAQQARDSWLGPLAGLAAGLGLGALLAGGGLPVALLAIGALLLVGLPILARLLRRAPAPAPEPLQYAGVGGPSFGPLPEARTNGQPGAPNDDERGFALPRRIPDGFDADAFLGVARQNFIRLQAANDRCAVDELGEFTTPDLFAAIREEIESLGCVPQRTEVVTLDAELLEVVSEATRHVASVRYHGMLREGADAPAVAFDEIWHLVMPADGADGWRVAGIQQVV